MFIKFGLFSFSFRIGFEFDNNKFSEIDELIFYEYCKRNQKGLFKK